MTTQPKEGAKTPRGVRVLLFCSLAVNLLVVGLIAGAIVAGGPGHKRGDRYAGPDRERTTPYVRALEREDRRALGRMLREQMRAQVSRDNGGDDGGNVGGDSRRIKQRFDVTQGVALLQADPFDAAAFGAMLEDQYARAIAAQTAGRTALVAHIAQMTDAERAAYAERLQKIAQDSGKFKRKHKARD